MLRWNACAERAAHRRGYDVTETGDDERILPGAIVKKIVTGADGALEPLSAETQQFKPHGQKQVSILPYTSLANFHLWPQNPVPLGVIERGRIMRAQRVWLRVEHDYSAERVHLALR